MTTIIKILSSIFIAGLLAVAIAAVFNVARMRQRDVIRAGDVAVIKSALVKYFSNSMVGYPPSTGECLNVGSGVGRELLDAKLLLRLPVDPLWPAVTPANGEAKNAINFCYYYKSAAVDGYELWYYLESTSRAGRSGPHLVAQ
jgi:hypothetical protein